jgi:hypothetical protein
VAETFAGKELLEEMNHEYYNLPVFYIQVPLERLQARELIRGEEREKI